MGEPEFFLFVGIDWADQTDQVCLVDGDGTRIKERKVKRTADDLAEFVAWLDRFSEHQPDRVAVAIEVTRDAVITALIERGFAVFSLNPKQLDRFRDRHSVAGAKDDRRDAYVLADALRTDRHLFQPLRLDNPLMVQLREASRAREEFVAAERRLSNQLREQLRRFAPEFLKLSPAADERWFWDVVTLLHAGGVGQRVRPTQVARVLKQHGIRRLGVEEVLAGLRARFLPVAPGVLEAAMMHIGWLLPTLVVVHRQAQDAQATLERLLAQLEQRPDPEQREHRDATIVHSLPGAGPIISAAMLAEGYWTLEQRDYHTLRALAGVAPVTRQSGKQWTVGMRYACNHRLRNVLFHLARNAIRVDPRLRTHYDDLRARGKSWGRALRAIGDALLRILIAMLKTRTLYDRSRRLLETARAA